MRVDCLCVADFIQNLTLSGPDCVLDKSIYVNVNRRPFEGDKHSSVKFQVTIQASAVVAVGEDGQYLLSAGEDCGMDYEDSSQEKTGSEKALELRKALETFCSVLGITIRPGIVSE